MAHFVALLRGINVGTAKAISMAELAEVFSGLGATEVRTVLRSGNVVFSAAFAILEAEIEAAVLAATGVQSSVLLVPARLFCAIASANPLVDIASASAAAGSTSFVTFTATIPKDLVVPDAAALAPELLGIGAHALYQWIPDGSMATKVPQAFWKQFPGPVTTRNWNTVQKLLALLQD